MIPHKCTPYCEPDDGVHCIPDRWPPHWTTKEQWETDIKEIGHNIEIVRMQIEPDVTPTIMADFLKYARSQGWRYGQVSNKNQIGYLLWIKDRL